MDDMFADASIVPYTPRHAYIIHLTCMCVEMCTDMSTDISTDMCTYMCTCMRTDMHTDICGDVPYHQDGLPGLSYGGSVYLDVP